VDACLYGSELCSAGVGSVGSAFTGSQCWSNSGADIWENLKGTESSYYGKETREKAQPRLSTIPPASCAKSRLRNAVDCDQMKYRANPRGRMDEPKVQLMRQVMIAVGSDVADDVETGLGGKAGGASMEFNTGVGMGGMGDDVNDFM
jgi:hypothetical protein